MKLNLLPLIFLSILISACGSKNESTPVSNQEPDKPTPPIHHNDDPNKIVCTRAVTDPVTLDLSRALNLKLTVDIAEPSCFKDDSDAIEFACTDPYNAYVVEGKITREYPHFEQSSLGLGNFTACYFQSVGIKNPLLQCSKETILFKTRITGTACVMSAEQIVRHNYSTKTLNVKDSMMTQGVFFPIKREWYGPLNVSE